MNEYWWVVIPVVFLIALGVMLLVTLITIAASLILPVLNNFISQLLMEVGI